MTGSDRAALLHELELMNKTLHQIEALLQSPDRQRMEQGAYQFLPGHYMLGSCTCGYQGQPVCPIHYEGTR